MTFDEDDLDIDDAAPSERPGTALGRARALSLALSDAARRARLSTRRSRQLSGGGFENRRGAKWVRRLLTGSFLALCVAPTLGAAIYFGLIASDQFVAQAEFTVSAGESPLREGGESFSGPPAQLIIQDTQIINNFIHSREIVDKLEASIGLRKIYSRDGADWLASFNPERPVERLVKYWARVSSASIKLPGGIVKFSVRAFTPQDAKKVADSTLALCEDLVNQMNARINHDAMALAEESMTRAAERLAKTLASLEIARNGFGVVQANLSAQAETALLNDLKTSLLSLSGAYDAQLKDLHADTPQMRELKARVDVLKRQVTEIEARLTVKPGDATPAAGQGDAAVSTAMTGLSQLEVEQKADEQLYENAAAALEHAKLASEFRMIYLKVYVRPSLPEESEYPERALDVALIAVASLALWGVLVALGAVVRNNMA